MLFRSDTSVDRRVLEVEHWGERLGLEVTSIEGIRSLRARDLRPLPALVARNLATEQVLGLALAGGGLAVALVERDKVGGTCLHRGCIPAKELLETAAVHRTVTDAAEFGVLTSPPSLDFSVTQARKQRIVDGLDRKSTRLNFSHSQQSRMPSSA